MVVLRVLDHSIYSRKAIGEARTAYKDHCSVTVEPLPGDRAQLRISVLPKHEADGREVVLSFLNYALDKASERQLRDA